MRLGKTPTKSMGYYESQRNLLNKASRSIKETIVKRMKGHGDRGDFPDDIYPCDHDTISSKRKSTLPDLVKQQFDTKGTQPGMDE